MVLSRIEDLVEIEAIRQLKMRYCLGLDSKDWALYRSCFADGARLGGGVPGSDSGDPQLVGPDVWVASVAATVGTVKTSAHGSRVHRRDHRPGQRSRPVAIHPTRLGQDRRLLHRGVPQGERRLEDRVDADHAHLPQLGRRRDGVRAGKLRGGRRHVATTVDAVALSSRNSLLPRREQERPAPAARTPPRAARSAPASVV